MQIIGTLNLTNEEHILLKDIFAIRLRIFLSVFFFLYATDVYALAVTVRRNHTVQLLFNHPLSDIPVRVVAGELIGFGIVTISITAFALGALFRRILPFYKDSRRGIKQMISYRICNKSFFPITNQYFISFDDPDYMHHEVDAAFYNACSIGDQAFLGRAPHSKYVFEKNDRFKLM